MDKIEVSETITLLSELIQNKCVNPPGNELKSINTIYRYLSEHNVKSEIFKTAENRGNLYAKIAGDPNGKKLMFGPSHVDVVPVVKPNQWTVDPFSGTIKDEQIWGRGSLDMLFIVATQIQAFVKLHKENFKPKGDLILLIVSDEEAGGTYGTKWMCENKPELIDVDYAVTESGGLSIAPSKFVFMAGEKGGAWKRIKFKGTPGHGSMPFGSDNAVIKASQAAIRLSNYCDSGIPITTKYLTYLASGLGLGFFKRLMLTNRFLLPFTLKQMKNKDPAMAKVIHGLSRMTISPNILHGGTKINVIPASAHLDVDVRTLPQQGEDYVKKHLMKGMGEKLAKDAIIESPPAEEGGVVSYGNESPVSSEFVSHMENTVNEIIPGSTLVPFILPAITDCRFLRERGVAAYGFSLFDPATPMSDLSNLAHGVDERVSIKTLELSQLAYYKLARNVLG
ncbi:MAG: M20/M25/M40 family metallo-hydrolase [Candidatus Hodarchaeales archaeon]